jgi:hypothetical protein
MRVFESRGVLFNFPPQHFPDFFDLLSEIGGRSHGSLDDSEGRNHIFYAS